MPPQDGTAPLIAHCRRWRSCGTCPRTTRATRPRRAFVERQRDRVPGPCHQPCYPARSMAAPPSARGGGVDCLRQRAQADLAPLQVLDRLDQLPDRAGEPVELPEVPSGLAPANVADALGFGAGSIKQLSGWRARSRSGGGRALCDGLRGQAGCDGSGGGGRFGVHRALGRTGPRIGDI
jgi:hypothetical protein